MVTALQIIKPVFLETHTNNNIMRYYEITQKLYEIYIMTETMKNQVLDTQ